MKLSSWIELKGITRAEAARMIGVSPGMITLWCDGSYYPSRDSARRIVEATKGAVTPSDFLEVAS